MMSRVKTIVLISSLVLSIGSCADPPASQEKELEWLYDGKPLDDWLAELRNDAEVRRKDAVEALRSFLQDQRHQVQPALLGRLNDSSPAVRAAAVQSLAWYGPQLESSDELVQALRERLIDSDENQEVRETAARGLGNLGIAGAHALAAARDPIDDPLVRRTVIDWLGRMPHDLCDQIEGHPVVRNAFERWAKRRPRPTKSWPERLTWMRAALEQAKDPQVRKYALERLEAADQIEGFLVEQLVLEIEAQEAPSDSRAAAMLRLAGSSQNEKAVRAIPSLLMALESDDEQFRFVAATTLAALSPRGQAGDRAIDFLVDHFVEQIQQRDEVGEELGWQFVFATVHTSRRDEIFQRVMARLNEEQAGKVQQAQFGILRNIDQYSPTLLIPMLEHKDWSFRKNVAEELGAHGRPIAKEAVAALARLLENPEEDARVVVSVTHALARLDTEAKWFPRLQTETLMRLVKQKSLMRRDRGLDKQLRDRSDEIIEQLVKELEELPAQLIKLEPGVTVGGSSDDPTGPLTDILAGLGEPAVPALRHLLIKYAADWRSYHAAGALARSGPAGIEVLVDLTENENPHVRSRAARAVAGGTSLREQVTKALVAAARDPDTNVRTEAIFAIANFNELGPDKLTVLPVLTENLHHKERQVAFQAAKSLRRVGQSMPEQVIPVYRAALGRVGWQPTSTILDALREFGEAAAESLPEVRKIIENDKKDERALATVAAMGPAAKGVEDLLLAELDSPHPQRRFWAAVALSHFDSGVDAALPVLIHFLRAGGRTRVAPNNLRILAAEAIGQIGPAAEPAIDPLVELVRTRPNTKRRPAVKRPPSDKRPPSEEMEELSNDRYETFKVMAAAAEALGRIGRRAETVVPALTDTTELSPAETVAPWAASALRHFGADAASAADELVRSIEQGPHAETLLAIGKPAVPVVAAVLQDDDRKATPAAELLGKMGPMASAAVPALLDVVRDRRRLFSLREAAIRALGEIGPAARPAVPYLEALSATDVNSDWTNRQRAQAAREALDRIHSSEGAAASEDCVSNRQVNRCVKPADRLTPSRRRRRV